MVQVRRPPGIGKVAAETFERVIAHRVGAPRPEVIVGPRHGVDVGIVDLADGRVIALTTDPLFVMPEYGWERAAWFAVHIIASDIATSGFAPSFCTVDLNVPPLMSDEELQLLWTSLHVACRDLGVSIVTGHTGRYDGCTFPMLGSATMIGIGPADRYVTPAMATPGDRIIVTKGAAIETAGMFGAAFPKRLADLCGREIAQVAGALFDQMSVVRDARVAIEAGVRDDGVSCMHDATERGVWGGLVEIAEAAGVGLLIEEASIPVPPAARAVCELFGIDPYSTSSEGTLLLACRPHKADEVLRRLEHAGILAAAVGEVMPAAEGIRVARDDLVEPLTAPESDPFWPAFQMALQQWGFEQ